MCGRTFQTYNITQLLRIAGTNLIQNSDKHSSNYNVSPGDYLPVIKHVNNPENNNRVVDLMKWGYQPYSTLLFNARAETADQKPLFKELINSRRGVIIVEGYFEWALGAVPFVFIPKKRLEEGSEEAKPPCLLLAGFYAHDGTFVILTRNSIGDASQVNRRMPVILSEEEVDKWLDCDQYKYEDLKAGILDNSNEKWKSTICYEVSTFVNNAANKTSDVLKKVEDYDAKAEGSTIDQFLSSENKNKDAKFELGKRGDETDDEEDLTEEKTEEEEEPKKKKVTSVKKISSKAAPVTSVKGEADDDKIQIHLSQSQEKIKLAQKEREEERKNSEEVEGLVTEIKKSLGKSGVKLGSEYQVKEVIVVVEKTDSQEIMEQEGKENIAVNVKASGGKGSSKKRKDFPGKDEENEFTNEKKKQKSSPNPFGVRN